MWLDVSHCVDAFNVINVLPGKKKHSTLIKRLGIHKQKMSADSKNGQHGE